MSTTSANPNGGPGHPAPRAIVGLGASAGGLDALEKLLSRMPAESGLTFVVVQHLDPRQPSLLAEILGQQTPLPVVIATSGTHPQADRVYVIEPKTSLTIEGGALHVVEASGPALSAPVDTFLRSLAEDQGERAIAVLLSGAGHDGTAGLRAIRERGGLTLAQSPPTAEHRGMLEAAIEAGLVDHVLPVEEMPARLLEHAGYLARAHAAPAETLDAELAANLGRICALVQQHTGHDFSRYKGGTLLRRIRRRLQVQQASSTGDYLRLLEREPGEAEALLKDLLIGVTQFFRDPDAFRALAREVLPRIAQERPADTPLRIWVPGCASGEEAYTIAILVREHLDRAETPRLVQIFATDLDAGLLTEARQGRYDASIAEHVSPERLGRFFVRERRTFQAAKALREMCIFSQHSVIRDPPFSQLDLISCRNVLIYLNAELQKKLVPLFHYALRPGGFLLLGPSEGVAGSGPDLFDTVDKNQRIFRRKEPLVRPVVEFPLSGRGPLLSTQAANQLSRPWAPPTAAERIGAAFERTVLEEYSNPSAIINERGDTLFVAGPIGRYLQLPAGASSVPNLLEAFRGSLGLELRSALRAAHARRGKVVREGIPVETEDVARRVRLVVRPAPRIEHEAGLFLVVLQDEAPPLEEPAEIAAAPEPAEQPFIEQLEGELRTTRAELRAAVEDLESANEELKSSNEELISTNEELQSANEELQSSHEELQSLNEELETVNAELRHKVDELATANDELRHAEEEQRRALEEAERAEEEVGRSRQGLRRLAEASLLVVRQTALDGMLQAISEAALALTGARLATCGHGLVRGRLVAGGLARAPGAPSCAPGDMFRLQKGGVHMALVEGADAIRMTDAEMRAHPSWQGLPRDHVPLRGLLGARIVGRDGRTSGLVLATDKEEGEFTPEDESLLRQLATIASLGLQHVEARIVLEEQDRYKNQFLAMLSHELRNPLAPIRNSIYVLGRSAPGGDQARRALEVIDRQTAHLTRLVDDLLDTTRISRGKIQLRLEPLDLGDVVRRAVDDHRSTFIRAGIKLGIDVPRGAVRVRADRTRVEQIVGNLLLNAAKFTPRGGETSVVLEESAGLRQAIVRVRDTGVGITPELAVRIFEPFSQSDGTLARSQGGLGLGLALAKGLVEMHGGTVSVESAGPGKGAEFTVRFPLDAGETQPPALQRLSAVADGQRRVLVVEDNVDAAESLRDVLQLSGHTIELAFSGLEGLARARELRPDVVLCDIGLPGMDGYEVARAMRSDPDLRGAKLVALTGYAAPEDLVRSREAGFDVHLAKPPPLEQLEEVIATCEVSRPGDEPGR